MSKPELFPYFHSECENMKFVSVVQLFWQLYLSYLKSNYG
jgi:hypothetical protein